MINSLSESKKKLKLFLSFSLIILSFLIFINLGFSTNIKNLSTLNYAGITTLNKDNELYVSYTINLNNVDPNNVLNLKIFFNNTLNNQCDYKLTSSKYSAGSFRQVFCKIIPSGSGVYTFKISLRNGDLNINKKNSEYLSFNKNNSYAYNEFIDLGNKTVVLVHVYSNQSSVVKQLIPKSVISNIKKESNLITSSKNYTIIKEDPIIAWNVENPPETINYTINKKINENEKKEFKVSISPATKTIKYTKYVVGFLIGLIIIIAFLPIIKRKKN
jgi:hypothetical protein